jgi:hypothetical protein
MTTPGITAGPFQPTVCLDFDGVIHSYTSGWNGGAPPRDRPSDGALDFVNSLLSGGFRVVYLTVRAETEHGKDGVQKWLVRYGFPLAEITDKKPPAIAYVDDRAVAYNPDRGDTFAVVLDHVEELAGRR